MDRTLLFLTFSCFLIQNIQSSKIPFENSSKLLTENYVMSAEEFASKHLSGTKFCESVLLPTDHSLIRNKTLQATLFNEKENDIDSDDNSRLDSCCRSLHKCDAYKNIELGEELGNRNDSSVSFCDCVHFFRACLKKLNNSVSSDLVHIHSINATKCYAKEHPIIKCIDEVVHPNPISTDTVFNRCNKYEFDYGQPKKLQLLDLPFINSGTVAATVKDKVVEEQDIEADNRTRLLSDFSRSILKVLKNGKFILFFNGVSVTSVTFSNNTINFN